MSEKPGNPVDRKTFETGKVINGYEVQYLIGIGGFGDVYKVTDKKTHQMFAMKTESFSAPKKALQLEIECLQHIKGDGFPKMRAHGTDKKNEVDWLVMNMYAASIGTIRRQKGKLQPHIALSVSKEMLKIIKSFHEQGWIHRDIKPSNFLLQQNSSSPLVLIDFGLSKRHIDPETGNPFPAAEKTKFTGTKKYSSVNAQRGIDLGRCDDLISWYYSMIEIAKGKLPWGDIQDAKEMCHMKESMDIAELCAGIPSRFIDMWTYISQLKYDDTPDYDRLVVLLDEMLNSVSAKMDWNGFYAVNSNLGDLRKSISSADAAMGVEEGGCCSVQ